MLVPISFASRVHLTSIGKFFSRNHLTRFCLTSKNRIATPLLIVIDVTETPIERPKKNKNNFIVGRRKDIH
jgi:hypothetical protein